MTIEVTVPDDVFTTLRKSPNEVARDLRIAAAVEMPRHRELIPVARPLVAAIRGFGYYIEDHLIEAALRQVGETWME